LADGLLINTGVDTSAIFSTTGTKSGTSGFKNSAGTDLYAIYGKYTSGTKFNCGLKDSTGTDLGQILQLIAGGGSPACADSPTSSTIYISSLFGGSTTSASTVVNTSGGTVTGYSWARTATSGSFNSTISSPTSSSPSWSYTYGIHATGTVNETWTCTVSFSVGGPVTCTFTIYWFYHNS
jgi:hypothetical protein